MSGIGRKGPSQPPCLRDRRRPQSWCGAREPESRTLFLETLLLSDAAFRGSTVTPLGRTVPAHRVGARRSLVAVVLALALASCQAGVLDPRGPVGAAQRTILINALAIMLAIVVPTIVATLGFSWWFRASNTRAQYRPDWAYSGRIELVRRLVLSLAYYHVPWGHRLDRVA